MLGVISKLLEMRNICANLKTNRLTTNCQLRSELLLSVARTRPSFKDTLTAFFFFLIKKLSPYCLAQSLKTMLMMGSHSLSCLFIGLCILQGLGFWFSILGKCFHSHRYRNMLQSWQVCCAKGEATYNSLEETVSDTNLSCS